MPQEVATELQRVVQRWHQLPLEHALSQSGRVRALVQSLADGVAETTGVPASVVPDCGPATLMDQLTVLTYDACAAAETSSRTSTVASTQASTLASTLEQDLVNLRRDLA